MRTVRTITAAREALHDLRGRGTVGLVPTMGAFHGGHLALIEAARAECDVTVVSIFLNPAQFGAGEDFERYPRDEEHDLRIAEDAGVDLVFAPPLEEMYPPGFQTWVEVTELSRGLEGEARPGHFRGVATVCLKLFTIVRPDHAYFGRKDAQQAAVIARMIEDLALELELRVVPTVREEDGLALSSRNALLTPAERDAARALPDALFAGEHAHRNGGDPVATAREILAASPALVTDYVELARLRGELVLLATAHAGRTRLIDNVVLEGAAP
jgi:pantoate--beta-alanine ligase